MYPSRITVDRALVEMCRRAWPRLVSRSVFSFPEKVYTPRGLQYFLGDGGLPLILFTHNKKRISKLKIPCIKFVYGLQRKTRRIAGRRPPVYTRQRYWCFAILWIFGCSWLATKHNTHKSHAYYLCGRKIKNILETWNRGTRIILSSHNLRKTSNYRMFKLLRRL